MGRFVKGDVAIVYFPFTDDSQTKKRPALVLAESEGDDLILCQITSQRWSGSRYAVLIDSKDFDSGSLRKLSYARPDHLFTVARKKILHSVGKLKQERIDEITTRVIEILTQ